jgi:outer membrane lipoprotein SlyB
MTHATQALARYFAKKYALAAYFAIALALSGCATVAEQFENRVYPTQDCTEQITVSWWTKLFGIAARISPKDKPNCERKGP